MSSKIRFVLGKYSAQIEPWSKGQYLVSIECSDEDQAFSLYLGKDIEKAQRIFDHAQELVTLIDE